jgi:hypothetical protein
MRLVIQNIKAISIWKISRTATAIANKWDSFENCVLWRMGAQRISFISDVDMIRPCGENLNMLFRICKLLARYVTVWA